MPDTNIDDTNVNIRHIVIVNIAKLKHIVFLLSKNRTSVINLQSY